MQLMIPVFDWWGRPGSPSRGQEALIADKASVFFLAFSLLVVITSVFFSTATIEFVPDTEPSRCYVQGSAAAHILHGGLPQAILEHNLFLKE